MRRNGKRREEAGKAHFVGEFRWEMARVEREGHVERLSKKARRQGEREKVSRLRSKFVRKARSDGCVKSVKIKILYDRLDHRRVSSTFHFARMVRRQEKKDQKFEEKKRKGVPLSAGPIPMTREQRLYTTMGTTILLHRGETKNDYLC